ncbi:molecular chaperone HtpG [Azospirillum fermentarium]|uniref:ATP-binding protein n=1 Tax=Azospirillum fermentarium TaxID=1233114 RepID=UPI0022265EF0|nr:ATP-binding protein [Azospirillum fermentarium]MCW2249243.1 molecular chaperone HtpG [Azospirillum fermentarium]
MSKHTNISLPAEIVIGKDVLELVSSAMYVDPLTIYREYIQNAADSIDVARATGVLGADRVGRVDITLDLNQPTRSVKIRDNGAGVPNGEFAKRLTAIGGSRKRGTSARGFRGVGRLAGLGYCQELIFRSRAVNDSVVQELRWDCRVFKKLLSDPSYQGGLHDLIQAVAKVVEIDPEGWPEHFYEVELVKPIRIGKDTLLNQDAIAHYLAQVAPVPFAPEFKFREQICEHLLQHLGSLGEIHIHINDAKTPIFRPYRDDYAYGEGRRDVFAGFKPITIEGRDGGVGAVGWLLHHGYFGAIPSGEGINGLRARKGNIQVGDHRIFAEVFPESRFASWTVGEIHILDERLVPNGRRDNFEQNVHLDHLLSRLGEVGDQIGRMCRSSSVVRNRIKAFDIGALKVEQQLKILEQGAIDGSTAENIVEDIRSEMFEIKRVAEAGVLAEYDRATLSERYTQLEDRLVKASAQALGGVDVLGMLPEGDRAVIQRMITLIYECSQNRVAAKSLVDRILARLGDS